MIGHEVIRIGTGGCFRISPLRGRHRSAAVVIAALRVADDGFIYTGAMTPMCRLSQAARVRRRCKRLHCCRNNRSGKRKQ